MVQQQAKPKYGGHLPAESKYKRRQREKDEQEQMPKAAPYAPAAPAAPAAAQPAAVQSWLSALVEYAPNRSRTGSVIIGQDKYPLDNATMRVCGYCTPDLPGGMRIQVRLTGNPPRVKSIRYKEQSGI
jgi:hypothetical protein